MIYLPEQSRLSSRSSLCSCAILSSNLPLANVLFSLSEKVVRPLASVLFLDVGSIYVRLLIVFTEGEASLGECCKEKPAGLQPRVLKGNSFFG